MAVSEFRRMLRLECVGHVVAFKLVFRIEEDGCAVGATFNIGQTQGDTAPNKSGPVSAGRYGVLPQQALSGNGAEFFHVVSLMQRVLAVLRQPAVVIGQ